jgi:hypothetical protein
MIDRKIDRGIGCCGEVEMPKYGRENTNLLYNSITVFTKCWLFFYCCEKYLSKNTLWLKNVENVECFRQKCQSSGCLTGH